LPFLLQRVLRFAEVWFEPVPEPRLQDWLGRNRELMQTFESFKAAFEQHRGEIGPSRERPCIHLLPLGPLEGRGEMISQLRDLCAAFFWPLRVAVLRQQRTGAPAPCGPKGAIDADLALQWLREHLRADSALTLAFTWAPLLSGGSPTVGTSDWSARVGICNLASCTGEPVANLPETEADAFHSPLEFERAAKQLTHQAVHMLGVLHCCYFRCLMNGSGSSEEADGKPPYLCGMCLKKLHLIIAFADPLERYRRLAAAWAAGGCEDASAWYETRVRVVRSTLVPPSSSGSTSQTPASRSPFAASGERRAASAAASATRPLSRPGPAIEGRGLPPAGSTPREPQEAQRPASAASRPSGGRMPPLQPESSRTFSPQALDKLFPNPSEPNARSQEPKLEGGGEQSAPLDEAEPASD
jgi:hypothetical protein